MTNTEFRTVRSYITPIEAQLAQAFLESEGIESFVRDEHSVGLRPYMSQALGGVRLDVALADLERASRLLQEVDAREKPVACPKCGGEARLARDGVVKAASLLASLAGMASFLFARTKYRCASCGNEWRR